MGTYCSEILPEILSWVCLQLNVIYQFKQNKVESQKDFFREIAEQPPKKLCAPEIFFKQHQDEFALILFHMSHVI